MLGLVVGFPYYIVRFKHRVNSFFPMLNIRFHTTQYDLNKTQPCNKICNTKKFPYYIVRFKLSRHQKENSIGFCFHTTQYDLNSYFSFRFCLLSESFHTTQYDLNLECGRFPRTRGGWFPYYIVRFKRIFRPEKIHPRPSFHTTQYDLNLNIIFLLYYYYYVSILHSTI